MSFFHYLGLAKRVCAKRVRRHFACESLESRIAFASDFANPFHPYDVNDDGFVIPLDVLVLVNEFQVRESGPLPSERSAGDDFYDANGDTFFTPFDVLAVINYVNGIGKEELATALSLSPASDPDGNGVVLTSSVTIGGQTTPGSKVRLAVGNESPRLAVADNLGKFQYEIDVARGDTQLTISVVDPSLRSTVLLHTVRHGDVVLDWNASMLNIVRDWTTLSNDPYPNRIVNSQPPMAARNLAMVHVAMYDAIAAIEGTHEPFHIAIEPPAGASPVAAAAAAAHRVASNLYKEADERAVFDAALIEALATVPDGEAETQGVAFGRQVGDAILAWRSTDKASSPVPYVPGTDPGDWQRTFPDFYPPLLPHWPNVTPFAMSTGNQFRAEEPPALDSIEYADAVDEVLRLGGVDSTERSAEQTEIALFWSDGGGTFTPAGHWNQIAADVTTARGESLAFNARMFGMLNVAMADAGIASWDAKYAYNLWRPIDAIRKADLDGNPSTVHVATWAPLLRTPPFPTYTSGHSTFSGAAAIVLSHILGSNVSFTSRTDGQTGFTQRPLARERIVTRSFDSFAEAAAEASRSRIYGGIHFDFDSAAGMETGQAIGNLVVQNFFRPDDESSGG